MGFAVNLSHSINSLMVFSGASDVGWNNEAAMLIDQALISCSVINNTSRVVIVPHKRNGLAKLIIPTLEVFDN